MIEIIFLLVCAVVLGSWGASVAVFITTHDLKAIKLEKAMRQHPHARKWRDKPLISVIFDRQPSVESEQSIRGGTYRDITIMKTSSRIRGKMILRAGGSATLEKTALRDANRWFQQYPQTRFVEIIPLLVFPQTIKQFFGAYHAITLAPFIKVRTALNVQADHCLWPTLSRKKIAAGRLDKWYAAYRWLVQVTNLALLLYVGNIALGLDQPDYLMGYMTIFGLWLAWSITNHPLLVWRQKIAYLVLAPASFGYFLWRAFAAPFVPLYVSLRKIPLTALLRRVLS